MNILKGNISAIQNQGHICLVSISIETDVFTSLVIEKIGSADYLEVGKAVSLHFKETEIILSKSKEIPTSLSNVFHCTIDKIEEGSILSKVYLNYLSEKLHAIITTQVLQSMELNEKDEIFAFVKDNEIMLSN